MILQRNVQTNGELLLLEVSIKQAPIERDLGKKKSTKSLEKLWRFWLRIMLTLFLLRFPLVNENST